MIKYSILMPELIERPIIRDDKPYEWQNKLTDKELEQRDDEIYTKLKKDGLEFPEINSAYTSAIIDTDIIYNMFNVSTVKGIIKNM